MLIAYLPYMAMHRGGDCSGLPPRTAVLLSLIIGVPQGTVAKSGGPLLQG